MQSESTISLEREPAADCVGQTGQLLDRPALRAPGLKSSIRRAWEWMSPFRIWRELRLAETARRDFAAGLAIGVFIACVPLYGLQTILGLFAARRLSLHPLPILAGSQLSAPPFAPVLRWLIGGSGPCGCFRKAAAFDGLAFEPFAGISMAAVDSFRGIVDDRGNDVGDCCFGG